MRCEVRETEHKGRGVFATELIPAGDTICVYYGSLITHVSVPLRIAPDLDYFLQISPELYVGSSGDIDDFVNHSCEPNAYARPGKGIADIVALRDINPGEEITYDYSLTSTDCPECWAIQCRCGSPKCRKTVSGFAYMPADQQREYFRRGLVPKYVLDICGAPTGI